MMTISGYDAILSAAGTSSILGVAPRLRSADGASAVAGAVVHGSTTFVSPRKDEFSRSGFRLRPPV